MASSNSPSPTRSIVVLGGLILVTAFLYWARAVLVPFALATFIAFILTPAVNLLQRRGLGRTSSVVLVVLMALSLVGGVGYFIGNQITGIVQSLPTYRDVIENKIRSLSGDGTGVVNTFRRTINEVSESVKAGTNQGGGAPGIHPPRKNRVALRRISRSTYSRQVPTGAASPATSDRQPRGSPTRSWSWSWSSSCCSNARTSAIGWCG